MDVSPNFFDLEGYLVLQNKCKKNCVGGRVGLRQ